MKCGVIESTIPYLYKGLFMELTKEEVELIAGFIGQHWQEFVASVEDVTTVTALHRLAEKLGLDTA